MITEPQSPSNGTCAQCRRSKVDVRRPGDKAPHNLEVEVQAEADPFCSTPCCRLWYGVISATQWRMAQLYKKRKLDSD